MTRLICHWIADATEFDAVFALVNGTNSQPYRFGEADKSLQVNVGSFYMSTTTVTQALFDHIMGGENPALHRGPDYPQENLSWNALVAPGGFFDRLNKSPFHDALARQLGGSNFAFRLPTETEWEYAARGGPNWVDGLKFSGSNDIDQVAWYDRRHGDHPQPVALKEPNQLGIYDMSGNVWEWCQDVYTDKLSVIPLDGSAYNSPRGDRVWRGGCFHNWAIHCTVSKRYALAADCHDGCIGFRIVFSVPRSG